MSCTPSIRFDFFLIPDVKQLEPGLDSSSGKQMVLSKTLLIRPAFKTSSLSSSRHISMFFQNSKVMRLLCMFERFLKGCLHVVTYDIYLKMAQNCCDRDRTTWLDMHSNFKMAQIFFRYVLNFKMDPNFRMARTSKWSIRPHVVSKTKDSIRIGRFPSKAYWAGPDVPIGSTDSLFESWIIEPWLNWNFGSRQNTYAILPRYNGLF